MNCSLPGSSVHEISQARILEWVAISPGDLSNPGVKAGSPLQAGSLLTEPPGEPIFICSSMYLLILSS